MGDDERVGKLPGQTWLWLYTLWYQVPPLSTSGNADALVWSLMMILTAGFVLIPFIRGLRSLPRGLGVYRRIWHSYYRSLAPAHSLARSGEGRTGGG